MLDVFCKRLKVKDGNGSVGGARGGGDVRRLRRGDSQEDSEGESDQWRQTCRPWTCTMEVLSLLKHSMSGDDVNPITKYFTLGKQCGSAGVEMVWKIYEAVRSEDKKEASVFIFEKKIADKLHKPRRREVVAETLRKDISHLERLRHPKILSLLHGLEECHDSLAFASEPVFASLANVLGNYERLPAVISPEIKEHEFIELEIKHGIVQITEALAYLHNTEHLIHCNICPQSILLTRKGNWKLMGFGFAEKIKDGKEGCIGQAWTTKIPKMAQPDLNYMAPEVQLTKKCSPLSDMFSVGMVICAIYNQGKSLINAEHSPNLYVKQLDQMQETFGIVAHKMPIQLVEPVEKMINKDIRYRPTAQLFSLLKYFNDPVVISLHGLDMCDKRDPVQRVEAYSSLSQVVPNIPRKMLYNNVLPELLNECKSSDSIVYALPTLITIIDYATRADYVDLIMPDFRAILANTKPVQATVYILNKLDILLTKSPMDEIKGEILPFVFNTLDSSSLQAQEAALGAIGVIKEYLDDNILRKVVLPKAKSLFFRSNNVKIRINALTCIDHLLDSLDKMLILDNILPFLANITAQDPDVIMCIVGIYKHMLSDKKFGLTHNLLATKVMPSLIPHTVNPGLTMEQFTSLVEVLREMLEQVDKQRRDKMKLETVSLPVPPRGSLKMMNTDNESDDSLPHQALLIETQRSQQLHKVMTSPGTPETQRNKINSSPKANRKNQSLQCLGMSLDEKSTLDKPTDTLRRHSLVPPPSGSTNGPVASSNNPTISITTDDLSPDRPRRPSTHSLGPFSVSGLTDFLHRGSVSSERNSGVSHRRPSMAGILPITSADSRRPSTHSVGILPISMFGEGGEKPRRPSTHSLGVFPFGCFGEDKPERPRRCSTHSLGPLVVP
ncbi:SCY1-like protein 2 isoform X2, partial [Biomphalaria glabrata]